MKGRELSSTLPFGATFVTLLLGAFILGGYFAKSDTELQFIPLEVPETNFGIVQGQDTLVFLKKWVSIEDSTKAKEAGWLLAGIEQGKMAVARRVK